MSGAAGFGFLKARAPLSSAAHWAVGHAVPACFLNNRHWRNLKSLCSSLEPSWAACSRQLSLWGLEPPMEDPEASSQGSERGAPVPRAALCRGGSPPRWKSMCPASPRVRAVNQGSSPLLGVGGVSTFLAPTHLPPLSASLAASSLPTPAAQRIPSEGICRA